MSLESDLKGALNSLVSSRVYPDVTPDSPVFPLIVYQGVSTLVAEYLESQIANKDNCRVQVWVWSKTRLEASSIARLARVALVTGLKATTYPGSAWEYNETLKLYGNRTDYSVWYAP